MCHLFLAPPFVGIACCCCCALAVTTLLVFSVNYSVVVDINDAIFIMAVDIVVVFMAIEYDNIHRVTCACK